MSKEFEDILKILSDTEKMKMNDGLTRIINSTDRELSMDELDQVTAASKADYEKFKLRLGLKDKCV